MKTFNEYLREKTLAEKTIQIYSHATQDFLAWLEHHHYRIEEISYTELLHYIKESQQKGKSKKNIQMKLLALRHYFSYQFKLGKVKSNPAQGVYMKGITKRLPHDLIAYSELLKLYEHYEVHDIRSQRDKVILGLLIFQAVTIEELSLLAPQHIKLREGKITIPGTVRTNPRILKLEATQVMELQEYMSKTRPRIVNGPKVKEPEKITQLILGMQGSTSLGGEVSAMLRRIKHKEIKHANQIRASVIASWTKTRSIREAQYMSGHKYVSTTERYQATHLESLQDQLRIHHPMK
jgi:integrase/recombinase XerD